MLANLTSPQLTEWLIYLNIEPIGELRADFRAGMICSTVANYAGKVRAEDADQAVPADFMPMLAAQRSTPVTPAPLLMPTAEQQADLIKQTLFKGL